MRMREYVPIREVRLPLTLPDLISIEPLQRSDRQAWIRVKCKTYPCTSKVRIVCDESRISKQLVPVTQGDFTSVRFSN